MPQQETNCSNSQKPLISMEVIVLVEKNLFEMKLLCDNARFIIVLKDPYTGKEVLLPKVFPIAALEEKISLGIAKDIFIGQEKVLEELYTHARKQLTPGEILSLDQADQSRLDLLTTAIN